MITQGETNLQYGEYVEKTFKLIDNVTVQYGSNSVIYTDSEDIPRVRIGFQNGSLCYDYFSGGRWEQGGALTPGQDSIDRFPQISDSYIKINDASFSVVQQGVNQITMQNDTITVNNKKITGIVPSEDPSSAVNLQQLIGVVQGETTDTIISTDMASKIQCKSQQICVKLNTRDAFVLKKPSPEQTQIELSDTCRGIDIVQQAQGTNALSLKGGDEVGLKLAPQGKEQLDIIYNGTDAVICKGSSNLLSLSNQRLGLNQPASYEFDPLITLLQDKDLIDIRTADHLYLRRQAQSALNMNGFLVSNVAPAVQSSDAVTLGQIPQNVYLYAFLVEDQLIQAQQYTSIIYQQYINPVALSPPISQSIRVILSDAVQYIQMDPGTYKVAIHTVMTYQQNTQNPVYVQMIGDQYGVVQQSSMQTPNVDSYSRPVHSERTFLVRVPQTDNFQVRVYTPDTSASAIKNGSSILIELLQR